VVFSALSDAVAGKYFLVEMLTPQHFRIQTQIPGPVSTSLVGGDGMQSILTRQENSRTVIYASLPLRARLQVKVGEHRLLIWMIDPQHYEMRQE
jgi:hypothetical protein